MIDPFTEITSGALDDDAIDANVRSKRTSKWNPFGNYVNPYERQLERLDQQKTEIGEAYRARRGHVRDVYGNDIRDLI